MHFLDKLNLGEGFKQYFHLLPALTDEQRRNVYRIRHAVYCRELGWEPVREDECESDEYDSHSLHCLLRTSDVSHKLVGCTRLVLVNPADPTEPLPFEAFCAESLDRGIIDPARLPREKIAEVSRLAVMPAWRRRKDEQSQEVAMNDADFGSSDQPRFPFIPVSLYLGSVALARRHGIEYLFTLTEPRLAQHFAKLGVRVDKIGEPVEHRGWRIPSMLHVPEIVENMRRLIRPIWHVVNQEIEAAYADQARQAALRSAASTEALAPRRVASE